MTQETETPRARWRMTFDELAYACKVRPPVLDHWAALGAFGPRLQEKRDRGWHRHVDRITAARAVIMSRLIQAGVNERVAAELAVQYEKGVRGDLVHNVGGVVIQVSAENLP